MTEDDFQRLTSAAVHEKLNVLHLSAQKAGDCVALRIDRGSLLDLMQLPPHVSDLGRGADGTKWRGLPIVVEHGQRAADFDPNRGYEPADAPPKILTVEVRLLRSGRTFYVNWPENPDGYR